MKQLTDNTTDTKTFFVFLSKKTERIVTALYVVTNLMPADEPLRRELRHKAIGLLGEVLPLGKKHASKEHYTRLAHAIEDIVTLMSVAHSAGIMSHMNSSMITKELEELNRVTQESALKLEDRSILSEHFFRTPQSINSASPAPKGRQEKIKDMETSSLKDTSTKNDRQQTIIALLKKQQHLSLGEIARSIPQVSEKTLQRDLLALEAQGTIVRTGKKRWTRYSLTS